MNGFYDRSEQRVREIIDIGGASEYREALAREYKKRYRDAFTPQTLKNLDTTIRLFRRWCDEFNHDPCPPVSPQVMADYVDYLGGKVRAHTIQTRLWGLAEMHRAEFLPSPCRHRLVLLALRAVKQKYGATVGQAPPLCKSEVLAIARQMGDKRTDIRDKALLLTASDSWCRASELVALKVDNVSKQEDGSCVILVERSKTDPYGRGQYAFLSPAGARAVERWVETKGLDREDPLFTKAGANAGKRPLVPTTVSRIFKKVTGRSDVSAHSTRIGGVHDALRLGCDLASIMIAGRWASPTMPAVYGRKIMASNSAASTVAKAFEDLYS